MRIAILGAGFAGMSVAYFLIHYKLGSVSIDLFDPEPIGGGVSGLSSGLLHTYPGKEARLSWRASSCMRDAHRLLTIASEGAGRSLILSKGILRPALTEGQRTAFKRGAEKHSDTEWWDHKRCIEEIPGLYLPEDSGGLYIKEGLTIDVPAYLKGLWQVLAKFGVQYRQSGIIKPNDLARYDLVLIAIGPAVKNFSLLKDLPINPVKGQVLELEWPDGIVPPRISLNSSKYLVMSNDLKSCTVGATFERQFDSMQPDQKKAVAEILPNITSFFPALEKAKILRCRSGFRAATPNHLPLAGQPSERLFFLTGLGSKGLLYHAWVGKRVARAMITKKIAHIPRDIRYESSPPSAK
ncbi:MAG: FAD-binding oxidoreductase [Chlamydiales bacterium]|nr:FAD-binding oxidoreductase [Chlamydiales bacterium]